MLSVKNLEVEDQLVNYNTYLELLEQSYSTHSHKTNENVSPPKKIKKIDFEQKQVEISTKSNSELSKNANSVLDNSIIGSTNAFVRTTLEKDGAKRDSDAFVLNSLKQNYKKERLEE